MTRRIKNDDYLVTYKEEDTILTFVSASKKGLLILGNGPIYLSKKQVEFLIEKLKTIQEFANGSW